MFGIVSHLIQQSEASLQMQQRGWVILSRKGNQLLGHLTQPSTPAALFIPCPSSAQNHPLSSISELSPKTSLGICFLSTHHLGPLVRLCSWTTLANTW